MPRVVYSPAGGNSIFSFPVARNADEHLCGRFVRRNHFGLSIPAVIAKFHQLLVFVYYVGANLTGN